MRLVKQTAGDEERIMFTKIRKSRTVMAATAAVCLVFATAAYAAFDGVIAGADGVIYACAGTDGAVKLAGSTRTCESGQKAFSWNQRGLRGPTGPQGQPGPAYFTRVLTTDNN